MSCSAQFDTSLAIEEVVAENYLSAHPYNPSNGLKMIDIQYGVLNNSIFDFDESWANWRRSSYPILHLLHIQVLLPAVLYLDVCLPLNGAM